MDDIIARDPALARELASIVRLIGVRRDEEPFGRWAAHGLRTLALLTGSLAIVPNPQLALALEYVLGQLATGVDRQASAVNGTTAVMPPAERIVRGEGHD